MRSSAELDVDFRLLGPFGMAVHEREIEIPSSKQRALLAMLAVHRNRAVPLETLTEELWGAHRPVSPAAAVQSLVYRLRRMLAATVGETGGDLLRASGSRTTSADPAMDWSYQLLPTQEQALLRRLSVFPQSFDLEAAEAVAGEEAAQAGFDVIDLLARLVDKSLVVVDSDGASVRYRLHLGTDGNRLDRGVVPPRDRVGSNGRRTIRRRGKALRTLSGA